MEKMRAGEGDQDGPETEELPFQEGSKGRSHWKEEICTKT